MKLSYLAAVITSVSLLTACGGGSSGGSSGSSESPVQKVLNTNADIAYAVYSDAVTTAEALLAALEAFQANPTDATLLAAKKAWLVAREPYGQTEVYRFRLSPIDSSDYENEDGPEGEINAWPLGEALIDYVQTNDSDFGTDQIGVPANDVGVNGGGSVTADSHASNIINTTSITINAELLGMGVTDAAEERDVIAGYHAIEFLLWGQDLGGDGSSDAQKNLLTDGTNRGIAVKVEAVKSVADPVNTYAYGGIRPLTDFTTDTYAARRLTYLVVAAQKLVDDLTTVRDGWAEGSSYRTAFTTISSEADGLAKLAEILTGMGTLSEGELAGERMQIAFSSNSQEDEHSCFSDNTHRDILLDAEGIANSFYGEYDGYDSDLDGVDDAGTKVSGFGIDDYLDAVNLSAYKTAMTTALTTTASWYNKIDSEARQGTPFDVQIMIANEMADMTPAEKKAEMATNAVYNTILALNEQSVVIAEMAEAMGIADSVVDDEASACDTTNPTESCDE